MKATKRILGIALALSIVLALGGALVAAEDAGPRTVDAVLTDIRTAQGVTADSAIDVSKVSNDLLEQLGDAVMEARIGNSAMHERMDAMLGGDGSASLTDYHVRLGTEYLAALVAGKDVSAIGGYYGGMMGGAWGGRRGGMMGGFWNQGTVRQPDGTYAPATSGFTGVLGWAMGIGMMVLMVLAIALLVVLIVRFARKPKA